MKFVGNLHDLTRFCYAFFFIFDQKSSQDLGQFNKYVEYSSLFLIRKEESMSIFLTFSGSWAWSPKVNFIQFARAKQETVGVSNGITSFLVSDAKVHTYITPPINQKGSDKNENLGQYFWLLCYVIGSANPAQLIRAEFAVQIRFISFKMTL